MAAEANMHNMHCCATATAFAAAAVAVAAAATSTTHMAVEAKHHNADRIE
jgi:formate hydrogenlyase subunit 3/multisubunit Na+/H+ antiporter MnhD subunit